VPGPRGWFNAERNFIKSRAMSVKILVTIPHFYRNSGSTKPHGSLRHSRQRRAAALQRVLSSLIENFTPQAQCAFSLAAAEARPCNSSTTYDIQILIVTSGDAHVLDECESLRVYFSHIKVDDHPEYLGYACRAALRDRLGAYHYYVYLEDDLVLHDAWFFAKLQAFREAFGPKKLLMPNRYERTGSFPFLKAYIDGPLHPKFSRAIDVPSVRQQEILEYLGVPVILRRPDNPHSGCYFLHESQMAKWVSSASFLDRESSFVGPLESAATLGIARAFEIYKPTTRNANFLEIEHFGSNWIDRLIRRGPHQLKGKLPSQFVK
jgi:hypothetical protein